MNRQKREEATKWLPSIGDKAAAEYLREYDASVFVHEVRVEGITKDAILTSGGNFSRFTLDLIVPRGMRQSPLSPKCIRPWTAADDAHMDWCKARYELNGAMRDLYDSTSEGTTAGHIQYLTSHIRAMVSK